MDGDFGGILKAALALPEQDKRRLAELMARLTAPDQATDSVAAQRRERASEVAPPPNAAEWLQTIRSEPVWVQLQLLEDAINDADDPSELQLLRAAHKMLLQENPPVAVRRAVVRVAEAHPTGICVGAVGLLFALFALGRGVFHLAF